MKEKSLRETLIEFLEKGPAHLSVKDAMTGIRVENRNKTIGKSITTIWEELEHMRLAQEDILHYTLDATWTSPPWPEGYWPEKGINLSDDQWDDTVTFFLKDLRQIVDLVNEKQIDLTEKIPHGGWHTYLREILLVIDHNAYHLGKIVHMRRLLGDLPE